MPLRESYQKNRKKYVAGAVCLVLLAACYFYFKSKSTAPTYSTVTVRKGDINSAVQATGTINPLTTVPVGSYVSGTVQYIFADFNTRVINGQVLAQLDPAIYEAQVMTARGNVANAKANLVTLQANVQVDEANLSKTQANVKYQQATGKRSQDLFTAGVVSQDANDLTQSTLGQAQADVNSASAALTQAKAQLEQARTQVTSMQGALNQAEANLRYTTIISPIDGTVIARNIDVGQSVAASLQAPTLFTIAQDLTRMQVYAKTDESDTGSIKVGTPVTFQVDAFPTLQFHGRVSAVRLNAYTVQNVVTYDTVIDFDNPDEKLRPGETAYASIPTGHAAGVVLIPNAALTYTPDYPRSQIQSIYTANKITKEASTTHLGGWQVVWKFGADHKPFPIAVRCGITDFNNTQLLEGDLHEGDVLITGQTGGSSSSGQKSSAFGGGASGPRGGPR